jgi:hypothetical protein
MFQFPDWAEGTAVALDELRAPGTMNIIDKNVFKFIEGEKLKIDNTNILPPAFLPVPFYCP